MCARFEEDFDALRASDVGGRPHARTKTQTRRADYTSADRRWPRQARKYSSDVRGLAANGLRRSRRHGRRPEAHAVTFLGQTEGRGFSPAVHRALASGVLTPEAEFCVPSMIGS